MKSCILLGKKTLIYWGKRLKTSRKAACEWAGITEVPVIIRDVDDNQAIIAMVNSNIQREHVRPSEKAFAFKMRLKAMNRQGSRTDLTSGQLVQKLKDKNPTLV